MKYGNVSWFAIAIVLLSVAPSAFAQKSKVAPMPIIFAVVNDGKSVEPIAYVNKGKLEAAADGGDADNLIAAFNKTYYKPGTAYRMIFGSANAGSVTIRSSNAKADCAPNMATTSSQSARTALNGFVMALATNAVITNKAAGVRRKPTAAEKTEIDALAKFVFVQSKLTPTTLKYHNLTALDVDNDGSVEFVASYWIEVDSLTRGLVFLIAEKTAEGKYAIGHSAFSTIDQQGTMSGDIKDVDGGVYHELLLDAFDYDGDGVAEIFTYTQSFEGSGFNVYRRNGGKWTNVFEGSNYHCGY